MLTLEQEAKINGMKGITTTIYGITNSFHDTQCPSLSRQVMEVRVLAEALSIMAANTRVDAD